MELAGCDLEVDVNGEEVFLVNTRTLSSFSGRLRRLFDKPSAAAATAAGTLRVVLHGLPGGAEAFELVTRFCYSRGKMIRMTPGNACLLHCAALFMEMHGDAPSCPSLIEQSRRAVEGVPFWSWPELLNALRQCLDFYPTAANSAAAVLEVVLDSLAGRIVAAVNGAGSPPNSSPESTGGFRFSCDTKSTTSTKPNAHRRGWWFEDLAGLSPDAVGKVTAALISRNMDHGAIGRFLFYYLKTRSSNAPAPEKIKTTEAVVDLLCSLDKTAVPCKGLLGILRHSSGLNLSRCCRGRLETMIGVQLDQVSLDNLLVPPPPGVVSSLYDVSLVLRFLKSFLGGGGGGGGKSTARLKKVASLTDLYLAEVAPDPCLKPHKFFSLATALPDAARDSHDRIYRAVDMFLEVHSALSEEEKTKICCAVNSEKLSSESCRHLAGNPKFPSRTAIQALVLQQSRLKRLLQDAGSYRTAASAAALLGEEGEQVVLYAKKLDLPAENEKLRARLQGMQRRVAELEKLCRKMQTQMAKLVRTRLPASGGAARSLPRLCS